MQEVTSTPAHIRVIIREDDLETLHASYMPFIETGGFFIDTSRITTFYRPIVFGQDCLVKICCAGLDEAPLQGKVIWVNPKQNGLRPRGFAIQLGAKGAALKNQIERVLVARPMTHLPTYTL